MGSGAMPSQWERLTAIKANVHLILGEHDPKFITINNAVAKLITNATIDIIPESGHAVHLEQPNHFCDIVNKYLL